MTKEKIFKRNICFSFFEDYRIAAKEIENDYGKETVADYYNAIIDYALYEIEPEPKGIIKYVWPTTKASIDKSIDRRAKGFSKEDTGKTEIVINYKKDHPNATQREIAEATGVSIGKVNKVLKNNLSDNSNTDSNTITNSNSYSNTTSSNEREREHNREHVSFNSISNKKKKEIVNMFSKGGNTYKSIAEAVGIDISQTTDVINEYKKNPKSYLNDLNNNIIYYIDSDGEVSWVLTKEMKEEIETFGNDINRINKYLYDSYKFYLDAGANIEDLKDLFKTKFKFTIDDYEREHIR